MRRLKEITVIFLLAVVLAVSAASAKEASVLLQEGLYAEQVEGDLDAAIKIYRQVIAGSEDIKQAAAQATYRIAMCYLKKGRKPEAAKEFRNLLSKFPGQESLAREAQKQLARLEPPSTNGFGAVTERMVYDDGAGKDFMLDLDTGKSFSVSDANSGKSLESFILDRGIDVVGETKTSVQGLMGIDMVVIPIANERWALSPGDVLEAVSLGKPGRPVVLSGKGTLPATFIFKTIAGNMGVLQILEVQANQAPRYIRIRYKMRQQKAEREVFMPDADTKGVGVVLDLASGELLRAGTGQEQLTIFRKLGKGDLAYDGVLICLRGAKAKLIVSDMRGDHLTDLKIKGQIEDMTAYELELRTIPGRFRVTTAKSESYELAILSADSNGLTLRYDTVPLKAPPSLSPVDLSSPEATIKSFVKAVYDGNLEAAKTCVSKDGADYDEFKEMLATESNHPFQAMIKAMDVSVPVEITSKDITKDRCKIKWYFTLGRVYYFGENKMEKGTQQKFGSYLEFVGGKWLIRDI